MSSKSRKSTKSPKKASKVHCTECEKVIVKKAQALFVEEDVGRYFCSEPCIVAHFTPDIEKLEREYGRHVTPNDLSPEERERFAQYRWMSLEDPSEVWMEKNKKGDLVYTLVGEYKPENKTVWAVAVCLMLRGEPSFLYLAFVTSDPHLVDVFRKGEQMKVVRDTTVSEKKEKKAAIGMRESDRLAESWTESDSIRASILKSRKASDIPAEDFGFYQNCLEETLQTPHELWSYSAKAAKKVYHFMKKFEHDKPFWYVVIARDTTDDSQIEIVDVFPTRDDDLIQMCRHGQKEILPGTPEAEAEAQEMPATGTDGKRNVH